MKGFYFTVECEVCGWTAQGFSTAAKATKAAKQHLNDNPHRDFEDVPMF
jgi:hypothetical protein